MEGMKGNAVLEQMDEKAERVEVKLKTTRTRNAKAGSLPPQMEILHFASVAFLWPRARALRVGRGA